MNRRLRVPQVVKAAIITPLFAVGFSAFAGALEDYVSKADTNFAWTVVTNREVEGFTVTQLKLTSQKWRDTNWTHHMQVVKPAKVRNPNIGFLFITGDGDGKSTLSLLQVLAERAGAIAAVVTKVPNQPLYEGRKEDALIAYTLDKYLKTGDETWPLLFPMAKSAVKAMDAVQEFAQKTYEQKIEKFVVSGASKRGWTTWLTGAVDPRVKAIAPMVIDMLNMKAQTDWTEKAYGKQSEQIHDYVDMGLVGKLDTPEMKKVRDWIDPYSYRERYTMPKLLLLGTNDRYWTVDALRHYWNDLPGPKLVFQTPNAGHNLGGGKEATETLAAFFEIIADGKELPSMNWQFRSSDQPAIDLTVSQPAKAVHLWTADSTDRDLRDDKWTSKDADSKNRGKSATLTVEKPATGYRAYLGEVVLTSPSGHDYKLSTEARVTPDDLKSDSSRP